MNWRTLLFIVLPVLILVGFGVIYFTDFGQALIEGETEPAQQSNQAQETNIAARKPLPPASTKKALPSEEKPLAEAGKGPGWAVNCKGNAPDNSLTCTMSQKIVARQTGRLIANVTFLVPGQGDEPSLLLQLPFNLYLPAGVNYQIDNNTLRHLDIRMCSRNGCFARGPIPAELLTAFRNGKQMTITYKNSAEKDVKVPVSLDGFAFAHDKISKSLPGG